MNDSNDLMNKRMEALARMGMALKQESTRLQDQLTGINNPSRYMKTVPNITRGELANALRGVEGYRGAEFRVDGQQQQQSPVVQNNPGPIVPGAPAPIPELIPVPGSDRPQPVVAPAPAAIDLSGIEGLMSEMMIYLKEINNTLSYFKMAFESRGSSETVDTVDEP